MKKAVFILFVLVLLTTSVYAFSIKDSLTTFSIKDFLYNLFHKDTVGINVRDAGIEPVETIKISQNVPINPVSGPVSPVSDVSSQQGIQQSVQEIPVISSEQIQNDIENIQTQGTNIIIQKQQPQSIIITQENSIDQVPAPVLNGYLSLATLKQNYYVNEPIELTDPPLENSGGFFSNLIESIVDVFNRKVIGINIENNQIVDDIDEQWSVNMPINSQVAHIIPINAGDINNDGKQEIAIATFLDDPPRVFFFDYQGNILNGWPKNLVVMPASLSLGDLNNDGYLEIVVSEGLYFNDTLEENCNNNCLNLCGLYYINTSEEYDDCESRCNVYCGISATNTLIQKLYVWDYQGNLIDNWPITISSSGSLSLANMDNDNSLEIVLFRNLFQYFNITNITSQIILANYSQFYSFSVVESAKLYAFNIDGSLVGGFPKLAPPLWISYLRESSVGDINNDINKEIVRTIFSYNSTTRIYETPYGTFEVKFHDILTKNDIFNNEYKKFCTIPYIQEGVNYTEQEWHKFDYDYISIFGMYNRNEATLVDLDNDGDLEILSSLYISGVPDWVLPETLEIVACHHNGEMVEGFPVLFDNTSISDPIPPFGYGLGGMFFDASSPVVGDINGDGNLEIIVSLVVVPNMLAVYALDSNGNLLPNFPKSFYSIQNEDFSADQPIIADIDEDGIDDIVISTSAGKIYAINYNAEVILELNSLTSYGFGYAHENPVITDLAGDGDLEIITSTDDRKLISYDLNLSGGIEWPLFHYDKEHTGFYQRGYIQSPQYILTANQTSGVAPLTVLFNLNGDFLIGTQFIWYFGDNNNSGLTTQTYMAHVYQNEGNYNATVKIIEPENVLFSNTVNINVLPKSKIQNTGSYVIQGYLLMKIQKNINGVWQDYQVVVNDLQTGTIRTIQGNSYLALDTIWNPYNVMINQTGNYRVYAALLNGNGQVIGTMQGNLEDYYGFNVVMNPYMEPVNQQGSS
ncbi:MAG: FG-GAP-like repeat-containing protein [archaeon]